nr:hypothetical protein [Kineococcus siccus]
MHCHVVSTIRPQRLLDWAAERGVALPTRDLAALSTYRGLADFLAVFNAAHAVFRTPQDLALVAYEGVADAVASSNLRYREHTVNPDAFSPQGFALADVLDGLTAGLRRAEEEFGVGFGVVVALQRGRDLATAEALLDGVLALGRPEVVGFGQDDLAASGLEAATDWAPVYARAAAAGLRRTAHVGEIATASAASVLQAWDVLGLDRVDHGYHVLDDEECVRGALERGVRFDVTPVSAHLLSGWPLDAAHPVARMLRAGLDVNLSTDDETFFATSLATEYEHVGLGMGFGPDVVERLCRAGVEAAFCDESTREHLREAFSAQLHALRGELL